MEGKKGFSPKRLVLSGGAFKGYSYIGFWQYIEEQNLASEIKEIVGTSIGCFFGMLIFLGYTSKQMINVFSKMNIDYTCDISLFNLPKTFGVCSGEKLEEMIKIFIRNKGLDENVSLDNFCKTKGVSLVCSAFNVNRKENIFFQRKDEKCKNYIDIPLYLAVRASMNLPLVFSPVQYKNNMYIDSAVYCNIPMNYYTRNIQDYSDILCVVLAGEPKILLNSEMSIKDYFENILRCSTDTMGNKILRYIKNKDINIITIVSGSENKYGINMPIEQRMSLIDLGYITTLEFFSKKIKDT